jgi:lysophospholipase L1-like esterase
MPDLANLTPAQAAILSAAVSSSPGDTVARLPHFTALNNIIFDFGHSFVQHSYTSPTSMTDYSALQWACLMSGQRWTTDYAHTSGVVGDSIAQALTRLPQVAATDASTVLIQLGTNDGHSDGTSLATMQTGYLQIINALVAAGKIILVMPILPTYNYFSAPVGQQKVEQFNRWLFNTIALYPNVYVVDALPYWMNLTQNSGPIPAGVNTAADPTNMVSDFVHPTARGAFAYGLPILDTLNRISAPYPKNARLWSPSNLFDKVNNPNSNILAATGRFLTGGGSGDSSATGTIANGWSMGTSGGVIGTFNMVGSLVDKTLPNGLTYKMQQIVITNTGTVPVAAKFQNFALTPSTYYTPGSANLRAGMDIEVDAGAYLTGMETSINETGSTAANGIAQGIGDFSATASKLLPLAWSGRSRTPVIASVAGNTALNINMRIAVGPGGSATVRLGNPSIEVV